MEEWFVDMVSGVVSDTLRKASDYISYYTYLKVRYSTIRGTLFNPPLDFILKKTLVELRFS